MFKRLKKAGPVNPVQLDLIKAHAHSLANQWIVVSWCSGALAEPDLLVDERTQVEEMLARNIAETESLFHELLSALEPLIEFDEGQLVRIDYWLNQLKNPLTVEDRNNIVDQVRPLIYQLRDLVSHPLGGKQ